MKAAPILLLSVLTLQSARAQLDLPWEKETDTPPGEVEPDKEAEDKDEPPPKIKPKTSTPVSVVYDHFVEELMADDDAVKFGTPVRTDDKLIVSLSHHGKRTRLVFEEISNDGAEATVEAGGEESVPTVFYLQKKSGRWVIKPPEPIEPPAPEEPDAAEPAEPEPESEEMPLPPPDEAWPLTWMDLSGRRLAAMELADVDSATLRLLRNEIYARHGLIFKSPELKEHFENQSWYRPRFSEVEDSELSETETANVRIIESVEKARKAKSGSASDDATRTERQIAAILQFPETVEFAALLRKKSGAKTRLKAVIEQEPDPSQKEIFGFIFTGVAVGYDDEENQRFMVWERFAINSLNSDIQHYDVVNDTFESLKEWRTR